MFLPKDKFEVKGRAGRGTIVKTTPKEYTVVWDNHTYKNECTYLREEVEGLWIGLPGNCDHEIKEYHGAIFSDRYCEKCNQKET